MITGSSNGTGSAIASRVGAIELWLNGISFQISTSSVCVHQEVLEMFSRFSMPELRLVRSRGFVSSLVVITAIVTSGCGEESEFNLAPVRGKVTMGGEPVKSGVVVFSPMGTGEPMSIANIREDGTFELTASTAKQETGALVGTHKVRIYCVEEGSADIDDEENPEGAEMGSVPCVIPQLYQNFDTTPLQATVEDLDGEVNQIDFKLEKGKSGR